MRVGFFESLFVNSWPPCRFPPPPSKRSFYPLTVSVYTSPRRFLFPPNFLWGMLFVSFLCCVVLKRSPFREDFSSLFSDLFTQRSALLLFFSPLPFFVFCSERSSPLCFFVFRDTCPVRPPRRALVKVLLLPVHQMPFLFSRVLFLNSALLFKHSENFSAWYR